MLSSTRRAFGAGPPGLDFSREAFDQTLAAGLPVLDIDGDGLNVMKRADGRKFEIRWLPGAPSGENYEVVRELTAHAA